MARMRDSLRSKIILYSLSITFSILVLVIALAFASVRSFLRRNLIEATHYRLRIAMDSIDGNMSRIGSMADWASLNHEIMNFVKTPMTDAAVKRRVSLSAHRSLRESMYAGGYDKYIDKILIGDFNGESIQVGLVNGHASDYAVSRTWFDNQDFYIAGSLGDQVVPAPFKYSLGDSVVPILRRIYDYEAKTVIGFAAFSVNDQVFTDPLTQYDLETGTRLFAVIGRTVYDISDRRSIVALERSEALLAAIGSPATADTALDASFSPEIGTAIAEMADPGDLAAEIELNGKNQMLVLAKGANTGWIIAQTLPTIYFSRQNRVFAGLFILIIGGMLVLVFFILIAINRTVNQPIARINKRVNLIATGDFSNDPTIESENELGHIGRAINRMSKDIEDLIAERLRDEKAKKSLEFRMLQSQINPHFLYNALNIIKWTASIQKADGIVEMTSALATLLRHAARGTDELVPLALELDLVREYCTIQTYRSAGLFELDIDIDDAVLLTAELMKFTLQPLVENAILHGIEPKGHSGTVRIRAVRPEPDSLHITVYDDGAGIAAERLARILEPAASGKQAFNHIGLANVDERIKLTFGDEFGLSIESREGEYTLVTVRLPFVRRTSATEMPDA